MSIDTGVIRSEPHVEIGSLIQQDAAILVERWCLRAVEEQPTAKRVHYDVLRDQLVPFLKAMGHALKQAGESDEHRHSKTALEHGEQRWDSGWSLVELARDYQLLQLVILEYLEQSLNRLLKYREVMAVGVFIDDAVASSIAAYAASRDQHAQRIESERAEALKEASRKKDEFMAILGHELRNPLAPIQNAVKILQLQLQEKDPELLEPVRVIERQTVQLGRLVDDLLDLARIGQGRFELRKTRVNLTKVLKDAVEAARPNIEVRNHRFNATLPNEPLVLEGDSARLLQIVVNLLNNAAKYTNRMGQIWLSAERHASEAVIRVRDNGIGIAPEKLPQLFELFTQVDETRQNSREGLGIGLTLVKRLVELHGGTVKCHSEGLGQGCEVTLRIPILPAVVEVPPPDPLEEANAGSSLHVQIIEDSADARNMLAKLLRLLGHRVDVAENGSLGIEGALANHPHLALIDIGLPDMSGYEVAKRLRSELGDGIFLIALTGYGQIEDLREALDAGFNAHLVKPADLESLRRLLQQASTRDRTASCPASPS